jgi:glycopeptide antibiotics resistance protein
MAIRQEYIPDVQLCTYASMLAVSVKVSSDTQSRRLSKPRVQLNSIDIMIILEITAGRLTIGRVDK